MEEAWKVGLITQALGLESWYIVSSIWLGSNEIVYTVSWGRM